MLRQRAGEVVFASSWAFHLVVRWRFVGPSQRIYFIQRLNRFSLKALEITETELNAIAAPAMMGLNRIPKTG
jgi:hypothetical protein